MDTILLGEAPKNHNGLAFTSADWSTQQIAAVVGVDPYHLNKVFWVQNVFGDRQRPKGGGYDEFVRADAIAEINETDFKYQRIICVGSRVAQAIEAAFGLPRDSIPENRFGWFKTRLRGGGWQLARIPHPSRLRGQEDANGLVLPTATRRFLRMAAGRGQAAPAPRRPPQNPIASFLSRDRASSRGGRRRPPR